MLWSHSHDSCPIYKRKLGLSSCRHVIPTVRSGDEVLCQLGPFWFSCRDNRATVWVSAFWLRSHLSHPAPTIAPSKKLPFWDFMDGMKLFPRGQFTWSVVFFFFFSPSHFFPGPFLFLPLFFCIPPSLNPIFFWELLPTPPTYLPTYLPSTTQPIYLPPICAHFHSALLAITIARGA